MLHELFITHCNNGTLIMNPFIFRSILIALTVVAIAVLLLPWDPSEGCPVGGVRDLPQLFRGSGVSPS